MVLRTKVRKEIKEALEDEGYFKEEIEKELNDLVEEEIVRREQEKEAVQRKSEVEAEIRRFKAEAK